MDDGCIGTWTAPIDARAAARADVLRDLEPVVRDFLADYDAKRRLWFPCDLLPGAGPGGDTALAMLRRDASHLPAPVRAALAMNLLTEEGLPHFHRLVGAHLSPASHLWEWLHLWTAEEDRHGNVLRDYVTLTDALSRPVLERMQYAYLRAGFQPGWDGDPYRVFVYTSLQERATQIAHAGAGRLAMQTEPVLAKIFQRLAEDEARHYAFYRRMFKEVLARDPDAALSAALTVMPLMAMPGGAMPHFRDLADVIARAGIYSIRDYRRIVVELARHWDLERVQPRTDAGKSARDALLAIPARLERLAAAIDSRRARRTFSFDVAFAEEFSL